MIDEYPRECLAIEVACSCRACGCSWHPAMSRLAQSAVKTLLVAKGGLGENGYIESADGKLRDELFSQELFCSQEGARGVIDR